MLSRDDYEKAYELRRSIEEHDRAARAGYPVDARKRALLEQKWNKLYALFRKDAKYMDFELARLLELRFMWALSYREIQYHEYLGKRCESYPRKRLSNHFKCNC